MDINRQEGVREIRSEVFLISPKDAQSLDLMRVIDQLNEEKGAGTIRLAATGPTGASRTLFQYQSPHYTTRLSDLPIARVG